MRGLAFVSLGTFNHEKGLRDMQALFDFFFTPPPLPPIDLPLAMRMVPGIHTTITAALDLVYKRGVFDGFVAGVLVSLLFTPSRKGAANVSGKT